MDDNQRTLNELLEQGALSIESWVKITLGFNNNREDAVRAALIELCRTSKKYGVHEVIDALTSITCNKPASTTNELSDEVERLKELVAKHDQMLGELIRMYGAFSIMAKAIRYKVEGDSAYVMARVLEHLKEQDKEQDEV